MTLTIRPAELADLDQVANLLVADAEDRHAADPGLWKLDRAARDKTFSTIKTAMEAENAPFQQQWLVAEAGGRLVGVTHSILLPVPPIYAGEFGPPGLIMEDCFIAPDAPARTRHDLLKAAEADLIGAGAVILLASSVDGGAWEAEYSEQGYDPLTMYFAKIGLTRQTTFAHVRQATVDDVPGIVTASAIHRRVLDELHHLFWKPHDDADTRFEAWMKRSLTLEDRDMFVSDEDGAIRGYAISQPATPLHFPTPHDISGVGVIDDFFHDALEATQTLDTPGPKAEALFAAAEAARSRRGDHSVLVVCPASWRSKINMLEHLGYHNAITWHIKMVG
ncbi:GNAT family N-acetyltransferase [Actibacterium sp. D379-3]